MSNYSRATTSQWYASRYPGAKINPDKVVLHTTEGNSWPTYGGGSSAPTYTARPSFGGKRLIWRAHFPDERSARALVNAPGGVETNTDNAIQVELIGTCDDKHAKTWRGVGTAGRDYIYWPDAPEWALRDLAAFLQDMNRRHGIPLKAPSTWLRYGKDSRRPGVWPASYGASPARMTFSQWRSFRGVCGHQHVPENSHGDPGALDVAALMKYARGATVNVGTPSPSTPSKGSSKPAKATSKAPAFPLPKGSYFGPKSGPKASVSGYYSHRADLKKWQARMAARGWRITADGLYGPATAKVARQFQSEKGLAVDGLIGAATWAAAWKSPVT